MRTLDAISIPPRSGNAQGLMVVLHGWGANAQDVAALATYIDLPDYHFLFPNAPFPHTYSPTGRAWYNFPESYTFTSQPNFADRPDVQTSRQQLTDWLLSLENVTGIPLSQTILGGFSQGGAMTLDVGLNLPLAALMVLSGYLHAPPLQPQALLPVLLVHGRQDRVVPLAAAYHAKSCLQAYNLPVHYHEFDMGHEIQPVVLDRMQSFIEETAPPSNSVEKPL